MRVNVADFYLHFVPVGLVLLLAVVWVRAHRLLRPANAPVISWEAILFQFVRWPWALIGCASAVWGTVTGRENGFKVTPKGAAGERPLPLRVILPYLFLAAVSILPVLLVADPGAARGYYFWALLNGATYLLVSVAVVALHVAENRAHAPRRSMLRLAGKRATAISIVGGVLTFGAVLHGRDGLNGLTWPSLGPATPTAFVADAKLATPASASVDIGVTTLPLASNATQPWTAADLSTVNAFERDIDKHASVLMWYADWAHSAPSLAQLRMINQRDSVPEITWEPWDSTQGLYKSQPRYALRNIVGGKFDAYIRTWARALAAYGKPVRLRFAQEMNGNWYPWGAGTNGNTPAEFVQAWRHVHDIFTGAGATNVQWVWSPVSGAPEAVFPGGEIRRQAWRYLPKRWYGRVQQGMAELLRDLWRVDSAAAYPGAGAADRPLRGREQRRRRRQGRVDQRHVRLPRRPPGGEVDHLVQPRQADGLSDPELPRRAAGIQGRGAGGALQVTGQCASNSATSSRKTANAGFGE